MDVSSASKTLSVPTGVRCRDERALRSNVVKEDARRGRRTAAVCVPGNTSSGGMFSPRVRDNFAIVRLRAVSSCAPNVGVAGELRATLDVGEWGELIVPVKSEAGGSRTNSTGREPRDVADGLEFAL